MRNSVPNLEETWNETLNKNPELGLFCLEQVQAQTYLDSYIKQAWHVVEPKERLDWGWHLDALTEHLTALWNGQIKNLLINEPPRHMKSLGCSVFFPTWGWIDDPAFRFLFCSYSQVLSTRDSLKRRRLINSPWYKERWGHKYIFVGDQNQKMRFENDWTGYQIATSVEGVGTGEGGDGIINDDPHNVLESESQAKREKVLVHWDEVMSTRLNNPKTGWKLIIMQRCHEEDLSGHVLESGDYEYFCLPARYEMENRSKTSLHFVDPRTYEGEPLWKERYDDVELTILEKEMSRKSPYAVAGQLQQRPSPRGGGLFETENFIIIDSLPHENSIRAKVRYWDKAGTQGGGKRTSGCLMFLLKDNETIIIADVIKGQWGAGPREKRINQTAKLDGVGVKMYVEQEPGSGGKESAENTVKKNIGFNVEVDKVTGAKDVRAEPYAVAVQWGNVKVLKAPWTKEFIDEHESFPMGRFSDQVDSASGAFNKITIPLKEAGVW